MKSMNLACPRCKEHFNEENYSEDNEPKYLICPHCEVEFCFYEFKKQVKREAQIRLNHPENQLLLSDTPLDRTLSRSVTMSFGEWIKWRFGHRETEAILLFRSSIHQVLSECCRLYGFYPAIPRQLYKEQDLKNFLIDPEHIFILRNVTILINDANFLASDFFRKQLLNRGHIRQIIDTELPHANWAGIAVTYNANSPEIKGFLLTIMMLKAQKTEIPKLFQDIQSWIIEDGWNEYGLAISNKPAS